MLRLLRDPTVRTLSFFIWTISLVLAGLSMAFFDVLYPTYVFFGVGAISLAIWTLASQAKETEGDQGHKRIEDKLDVVIDAIQAPSGPPLQRPARAEHFTGRQTELDDLTAQLQPERVVTLCGPGGIGKSALAAEALWRLAPGDQPSNTFPDGILWHNFYEQPQAAIALEKIALSFGEEPQPSPADGAQRALTGRCALLVLDGTEQADDLEAVLAVRGRCGVLITTRRRADALTVRMDIGSLPTNDALTMLRAWGGAGSPTPR